VSFLTSVLGGWHGPADTAHTGLLIHATVVLNRCHEADACGHEGHDGNEPAGHCDLMDGLGNTPFKVMEEVKMYL